MTYHTERREDLLAFFRQHPDGSYTPEEIAAALSYEESGRSTLFRLLSRFVAEGTLRKLPDGRSRHFTYQYVSCATPGGHLHLRCEVCGRILHVDPEIVHVLEAGLKRSVRFQLNEGATLLPGTCAACLAKEHGTAENHLI